MLRRVLLRGSGRESSEQEISSGRCAEQQQQPSCLQVAHCWYSFQESLVGGDLRSQMIFHEIGMPQRGAPRSPLLGLWSAGRDPLSKPPRRGPTFELLARGLPCASAQRSLDSTLHFSHTRFVDTHIEKMYTCIETHCHKRHTTIIAGDFSAQLGAGQGFESDFVGEHLLGESKKTWKMVNAVADSTGQTGRGQTSNTHSNHQAEKAQNWTTFWLTRGANENVLMQKQTTCYIWEAITDQLLHTLDSHIAGEAKPRARTKHTAMVVPAGAGPHPLGPSGSRQPLVTLLHVLLFGVVALVSPRVALACSRLFWRIFSTLPWALSIRCTSL